MLAAPDEHLRDRVATALHGRYDIERQLDHGATAVVFVAFDRRHERQVAIKVLRPELARTVGPARFLREVRTAAQLQHPHVVPVFDSGVSEDLYYFVMPLVAGESLQARLRKERQLPLRDALRIAREIADALAHAHARGLVHRDIKPANVLISGDHVAVTDFGIARALSEPDDQRLTGGGIGVGTPAYMSPEQATGDRIIDGRSDVYALGCVLYEMLVGSPPFEGADPQVVLSQHRHDPPPRVSIARPDVADDVNAVIATMLAKVPADRLRSAEAARERIDDLLLALATNELHTRRPVRRPVPRWKRWALLTIGGVGAVVGGVWLASALRAPAVDPNRILVFPLQTVGGADTAGDGLAVATYIGYALDGTRPLRWVEASQLIDPNARGGLRHEQALRLARSIGAGHYIDGAIVRERDSIRVLLSLHAVAGDTLVRREAVSAQLGASAPQLGVRAVAALVPSLVEPGRRIDFSPLRDRAAPAIAKFLQAERAYRASRLADALTQYNEAVALDSGFALAAIKGALAARALDRDSAASELYAVASRHVQSLPPRHASYAQGLGHYLAGDADSALQHFQRTLTRDSSWSDVWMAMAETYNHLLPNVRNADSLARTAYAAAIARDSAMVLARLHLAEHDLHEGRVASTHVRYAQAADSSGISDILTPIRLAIQCVSQARAADFWARAAPAQAASVLVAGKLLAVGASRPGCARAAFWRLLHMDSVDVATRWGALLTLHGLLLATTDTASLAEAYNAAARVGLPAWPLQLLAAAASQENPKVADSIATSRGADFTAMNSATLWLRATWSARKGDRNTSRDIARVLQERARTTGSAQDSLLAKSANALSAFAARDTATAIALLQQLRPHAPRADITWQPFAGLGMERLTLAELLLAKGRFADAMRVAESLEAPEPVTYLLYYRPSLRVRLQAARALGRNDEARQLAARLDRLRPAGAALRAAG
ncbi:MAG TPA: protein kinase [Gemmatimonadaceae bacterium]|nr:protein kinase [Gemmatimonadaceae bacterium]